MINLFAFVNSEFRNSVFQSSLRAHMARLGKTEALCNASNISAPFFNFKKPTNFLVEKVFFF